MHNKRAQRYIKICLLIIASLVPVGVFSAGVVPCGGESEPACDFNQFIVLMNNVIDFIVVGSVAVATILFSYAGFLLVTSGGNTTKKEAAKNVFSKTLIGFLIILAAWLIVNTLLESFLDPNANIETYLDN